MKYQLQKQNECLIESDTFADVWRQTVEHFGHLTIKQFNQRGFQIVQVGGAV